MKKLNKFFVFVLSLFCILGMVTPVFAEGENQVQLVSYEIVDKSTSEKVTPKNDVYTLESGKTYDITISYKGEVEVAGDLLQKLRDQLNCDIFEYLGGGSDSAPDENGELIIEYGATFKVKKYGVKGIEIVSGKPITFHIIDGSESSTDDYLTVTNFEDKTVTSGTELTGTFTTEWKNTEGHSWDEELSGSNDGGKTWEGICSAGSGGSDTGPKFVSTKDSGYQLKLVCTLDEKEIYNKVITVTVVDKTNTSEITEGTPTTSASYDELTLIDTLKESSYLSDEQKEAAKSGEVFIKTTASRIEPTAEDKKLVEAQLNSTNTVAMYLDLKVVASITKNGSKVGDDVTIGETGTPVQFTVALDDSFINTNNTVDRTYQVIRIHEGKVDVLPATFDPETKTITFESDKFSTYALMYTDTPKASKTPVTSDDGNVALYAGMGVIALAAVVAMIFFKKKNA